MGIRKQVYAYIQQEQMVPPSRIILAAVSGGVDSMVMAHVLASLQEELQFELQIASFDHCLRPEAAAEVAFVEKWAKAQNLPFYAGKADVATLAAGKNVQDTARRERYAFLRHTAYHHGQAWIATAHHQDDQAETVLMHLLRGSGSAGLAGIRPLDQGLIRPFLTVSRADIEAYAAANQIDFCVDQSNYSCKYLRNRIRLELLPILRAYNPQIATALSAHADISREEDAVLNDFADILFAEQWSLPEQSFAYAPFSEVAPALQRRLVRKAFSLLASEHAALSFHQTEQVLHLQNGQACSLPEGWYAYRSGDLFFSKGLPELPVYTEQLSLSADGTWHCLPGAAFQYCAKLITADNAPAELPSSQFCLPASTTEQVVWRTRRDGDWLPSRGKRGKRKLKELFIDHKIPAQERNSWPLLELGGEIVWVPGIWRKTLPAQTETILIKITKCDKI